VASDASPWAGRPTDALTAVSYTHLDVYKRQAVSSGGDVRAFKTTTLLSIEEGLHALGRASQATRATKFPDPHA